MTSPKSIFTSPESLWTTNTQKPPTSSTSRLSTPVYREGSSIVSRPTCNSVENAYIPTSKPVVWDGDQPSKLSGRATRPPISYEQNPKKRPFSPGNRASTSSFGLPFSKKPRIRSFPKHTVSSSDYQPQLSSSTAPTSPLFFSNHSRIQPKLPARYSSGEAGERMLSQAHAEENKVKTVTLARASYSGQSPGSIGLPSHRASLERSNTSIAGTISPEEYRNEASRILSDVGVAELLEQDFRPTFIVDLSDASNFSPGPLRVIFANSSLRSNMALFDFIQGRGTDASPRSEPLKGFPHFKAWLLSATLNGESLDVCLPAFINGDVSWSVSTIRKRLRVASASPTSSGSHSTASPSVSIGSNLPQRSSGPPTSGGFESPSLHRVPEEPQDYFGDAIPSPLERDTDQTIFTSVETATKSPLTPSTEVLQPRYPSQGEQHLSSSLTNELVLSAAAAGNVDYILSSQYDTGFFDWTRMPFTDALPRHIQFARSVDWASTPLGPIEFWSPDLRQMCNLIMASPHPAGEHMVLRTITIALTINSHVLG
jgi:hypothetical protein